MRRPLENKRLFMQLDGLAIQMTFIAGFLKTVTHINASGTSGQDRAKRRAV